MRDTLYSGKVFRTLNVIDEANRGGLGIDIAASIPAVRVIAFMAQLIDLHGRPRAVQEATTDDYNHLLQKTLRYVVVE